MDENRVNILSESNRTLSKLHLLAVFFSDEILHKVYLRSQIIHQLFDNDADLDINKLELFHLQFTAAVIDLLKKIKKNNEKNASLLLDEIDLNQGLISQLQTNTFTDTDFNLQKQRQALKVNNSLRKLYHLLSTDGGEYPMAKNINWFSVHFAPSFYAPVTTEVLSKLIEYQPSEVYSNAHAVIQRKLMGKLCKYDFKSEFVCGLKAGSLIIEVYKITENGTHYIFYPSRNLFLLCDEEEIKAINASVAKKKPDTTVQELKNRNDQLTSAAALSKTFLPPDAKQLLADYYKKISDVSFLTNMNDIEVQANILKTMLDTDML